MGRAMPRKMVRGRKCRLGNNTAPGVSDIMTHPLEAALLFLAGTTQDQQAAATAASAHV